MESFSFILSDPIQVSIDGDFVNVEEIICHSPSLKHKKPAIRLRQKFMQAIKNTTDGKENKETENVDTQKEFKGFEIEGMIFMGGGNDEDFAVKFMDVFEKIILTPGVAYVGKKALSHSDLEKISSQDFERLMGEYIANFFVSSWLPKEATQS